MLISAIAYLKEQKKEWRSVAVYGQEINALTSAIGRMNLFLHGIKDFEIVNGDTLAAPAFLEGEELKCFDLILANPPYSINQWDREAFRKDKYGRNFLGLPPQGRADYAFLQHILKSLDPKTGRCAVLFPHGVLFRKEEKEIVICRTNKKKKRRGRILFINAVREVKRKNAQSFLEDGHIERISGAYQDYTDQEGFAKLATIPEIEANKFSLSIPLYVKAPAEGAALDTRPAQEHYECWLGSAKRMRESYAQLNQLLDKGAEGDG